MSGDCQICHEHCLDCKCGKQELPNGLIRTGCSVKIQPRYICMMHPEKMEKMMEEVNHPSHYQGKTFEAIDIIEDYELNFNMGNAIKYILRCGKKGCKKTDIEKAIWCLQRELIK
jgi:hypothetical protein